MNSHKDQISRIKSKLNLAKNADPNLDVFGADAHQYIIHSPINLNDITVFEKEYNISLPSCYTAFLTEIGNGGISYEDSAAGPFYGIYPFGESFSLFYNDFEKQLLSNPVIIYPNMSDEFWKSKIDTLYVDGISDEEYEKKESEIYGGLLVIGTQGCAIYHCLVLNGENKGKIVNVNTDSGKPFFSFESNFLDWYERWLNDVIDGNLQHTSAWFGYQMGGNEKDLLHLFTQTSDSDKKYEILKGLAFKNKLSQQTLDILLQNIESETNDNKVLILSFLIENDYEKSVPYLEKLFDTNLNSAVKLVHWYVKTDLDKWISLVYKNINQNIDEETYRFATYILQKDANQNFQSLKPFVNSLDMEIRKSTFYLFSFLNDKTLYEKEFLQGLNATNGSELIEVLQGMEGLKSKNILLKLKDLIRNKFPYTEKKPNSEGYIEYDLDTDQTIFITNNIKNVLDEYGLTHAILENLNVDEFEIK